ncbi:hypothetical protein C8R45DRAFT_1204224 [Mycena sanguinolenta]|nr:hypothetical protein C8R45DRAFT_1204224 [Mycena sanguinolenta]
MSPIPPLLRTAIDLKKALDNAAVYLTPIGTCRSKTIEWRQECLNAAGAEESEDEDLEENSGSLGQKIEVEVMNGLYELQKNYMATVASGDIKDPLRLTITRKGCEYEDDISVSGRRREYWDPENAENAERLRKWYEAGAISGYGDVKAQETKVDPDVRDAREIPASEFGVSADLIAKVQNIWSTHFFPTHVRAEPYKIHIYGPGGKFKAHRDTPETDLVGTFLVGLGDNSKTGDWRGALEVKGKGGKTCHDASAGSWVAFYPDVEHSVREIVSGYRAVLAFKIFRQHLETPEVPADVALKRRIKDLLVQLRQPYGILLQHYYSAGTADLNGFDAVLHAAASETDGDVKLLPVLIRWIASRPGNFDTYGYDDSESESSADVFPMTKMHVDTVLEHIQASAEKEEEDEHEDEEEEEKKDKEEEEEEDYRRTSRFSKKRLFVDLKGTDAEWINYQSTTSIPFYSPQFSGTTVAWKDEVQEAIEHTGNESRPHQEDSIYLSYAIVVLPLTRGTKRAASEDGDV